MHVNENVYYITLWHYHKAIKIFFFFLDLNCFYWGEYGRPTWSGKIFEDRQISLLVSETEISLVGISVYLKKKKVLEPVEILL